MDHGLTEEAFNQYELTIQLGYSEFVYEVQVLEYMILEDWDISKIVDDDWHDLLATHYIREAQTETRREDALLKYKQLLTYINTHRSQNDARYIAVILDVVTLYERQKWSDKQLIESVLGTVDEWINTVDMDTLYVYFTGYYIYEYGFVSELFKTITIKDLDNEEYYLYNAYIQVKRIKDK